MAGFVADILGWNPLDYPHLDPLPSVSTLLALQVGDGWRAKPFPLRYVLAGDDELTGEETCLEGVNVEWEGLFTGGGARFYRSGQNPTVATASMQLFEDHLGKLLASLEWRGWMAACSFSASSRRCWRSTSSSGNSSSNPPR